MPCVVNGKFRPCAPHNKPGTHCIGDWMGPDRPSRGVRRMSPTLALDPQIIQPVAQSL